jgi:hypothetical protein
LLWSGGQEVEFRVIKIGGGMFLRSWDWIFLSLFMRSKFLIMIWSPDRGVFHEIEIHKKCLIEFRSHDRFVSRKNNHEIKIPKSIIRNFDLMINLLVTSTIMRSKFKINYLNLVSCTCNNACLGFKFQSHDQSVDLLINIIGQIRSHEQI